MIINLNLGADSYDMVLERGSLNKAREYLNLNRRVLVVTDDGVPKEYAQSVAAQCADVVLVTLPAGEATKCMKNFEALLVKMLDAGFTRKDCVAAVGGGVVGDLSGFAAACYMRGIDFYNIPTTLLSDVDSSIGGKTAIDLSGVKNIVGAFYQPKKVLIDPDTLKTLDERQLHAGLAEAVKMAATCDAELFELIESSVSLEDDLFEIIRRSLMIKKTVVEKDPKEGNLRRVLNFGHTVGHALESYYKGAMLHGECVAFGMLPMCSDNVRARLRAVLKKYNLITQTGAGADELLPLIMHDKKMLEKKLAVVLVDKIGTFKIEELEADRIEPFFRKALPDK